MDLLNEKQTLKIEGKLKVVVKETSQGFLGVVDEYPIAVEASDLNSLTLSLVKALSVYHLVYPEEAQKLMQMTSLPELSQ